VQSDEPEELYINEIMPEKLAMNLEYLAQRNTAKDMKIFLKTLTTLIADRFDSEKS
jgi:lipopolysaccharide/colanic/teichoic acid biosynthesis glycosyltransferase